MKSTKLIAAGFLGLVLLGVVATASAGTPPETPITGNSFQNQNMNAGEDKMFRFQNQFRFRFQTNCTTDLSVDVDDEVGDRDFGFEYNCSEEGQELKLEVKTQLEGEGLTEGAKIQTKSQNQYRYQEMFMLNITSNGTEGIRARLRYETTEEESTWAYLDEVEEEWVEVATEYIDGAIEAVTDHFSLWAVLTEDSATIPGYPLVLGTAALGIGIVALIVKKRK